MLLLAPLLPLLLLLLLLLLLVSLLVPLLQVLPLLLRCYCCYCLLGFTCRAVPRTPPPRPSRKGMTVCAHAPTTYNILHTTHNITSLHLCMAVCVAHVMHHMTCCYCYRCYCCCRSNVSRMSTWTLDPGRVDDRHGPPAHLRPPPAGPLSTHLLLPPQPPQPPVLLPVPGQPASW